MICHRIGLFPMGRSGLGSSSFASRMRVPCPPHKMTAFIASDQRSRVFKRQVLGGTKTRHQPGAQTGRWSDIMAESCAERQSLPLRPIPHIRHEHDARQLDASDVASGAFHRPAGKDGSSTGLERAGRRRMECRIAGWRRPLGRQRSLEHIRANAPVAVASLTRSGFVSLGSAIRMLQSLRNPSSRQSSATQRRAAVGCASLQRTPRPGSALGDRHRRAVQLDQCAGRVPYHREVGVPVRGEGVGVRKGVGPCPVRGERLGGSGLSGGSAAAWSYKRCPVIRCRARRSADCGTAGNELPRRRQSRRAREIA